MATRLPRPSPERRPHRAMYARSGRPTRSSGGSGSALGIGARRARSCCSDRRLEDGWTLAQLDFLTARHRGSRSAPASSRALLGSLWLLVLAALISFPLGVGAAIYLEEFAPPRAASRGSSRPTSPTSPACRRSSTACSGWRLRARFDLGRRCSPAALTLTLLILPIIIIASREAIRAVPNSIREGALALGATRWQTVRAPGSAGGDAGHPDRHDPRPVARHRRDRAADRASARSPSSPSTRAARARRSRCCRSRSSTGSRSHRRSSTTLAAAGIIVLLVVLLAMNPLAIVLRNKFTRQW